MGIQQQRGGKRRMGITEEHRVVMTQYVEEHPRLTDFNLFISRRQGRSKKGARCSYIPAGSRGPMSMSLVALVLWEWFTIK